MGYSIRQVCEKTGLTAYTLRFYEKAGLLTDIARSDGGARRYTEDDLECLGLICCLKNTGMPLSEIARFIALTREGDQTLPARCAMLTRHRAHVLARMQEMQQHLEKIECKITCFEEKRTAYESGQCGADS